MNHSVRIASYHRSSAVALALLACLALVGTANAADWELVRDKHDVRVWTRDVPGSEIKAVKAETVVPVELNRAMALMDDTDACPRWMHQCEDPKLVRKVSPLERFTYQAINLPWPATDRDVLVHATIAQSESNREVTVSLVGLNPVPADLAERMPDGGKREPLKSMVGSFRLLPQGDAATLVIYELHLELGGSLPASIVNGSVVDTPYYTLKNMRTVAQEPQYKDFRPF